MGLIQTFPDGGGGSVPNGSTITPTDDIQIWLQCAGLHQNYTTLNEVLADNAVLSALMASTNAVDYLVRSTTWATTICANETAMNCIGVNDYCADILLDNSTWNTAICNSAYWQEVLYPLIPNMNNGNIPTGYALTSEKSPSWGELYKIFDGQYDNDHLAAFSYCPNGTWINLKFPKNTKIYRVGYHSTSYSASTGYLLGFTLSIKSSNDNGSTYTNIGNKTYTAQEAVDMQSQWGYFNVSDTNGGNIKRINFDTPNYNYNNGVTVAEIQFYGRGKQPIVDTKADISSIGTEEAGTTASRAYAVGEHFYKNGKFCTAIASIASGATFTPNTNYVEGTIADYIDGIKFDNPVLISKVIPTSGSTRDTGAELNIDQYLSNYKYLIMCVAVNNDSYVDNLFYASNISIIPTKYIRKKLDLAKSIGQRIADFVPVLLNKSDTATALIIQANGTIRMDYYHLSTETQRYLLFATN